MYAHVATYAVDWVDIVGLFHFRLLLHAFFIGVSDYIDKAQMNVTYWSQETIHNFFEYFIRILTTELRLRWTDWWVYRVEERERERERELTSVSECEAIGNVATWSEGSKIEFQSGGKGRLWLTFRRWHLEVFNEPEVVKCSNSKSCSEANIAAKSKSSKVTKFLEAGGVRFFT